jgi:hypothetical protein
MSLKPKIRITLATWVLFYTVGSGIFTSLLWADSVSFQRNVWLTGWLPTGKGVLFREETQTANGLSIRVALLDVGSGTIKREFLVQGPEDKAKNLGERQAKIEEFIQKEKIVQTPKAALFSGGGIRGFLSLDGKHLLKSQLKFEPNKLKKGLQSLHIQFSMINLKSQEEFEIAKIALESVDGEHPMGSDSIGAISVAEISWGPEGKNLALLLEEKRPGFLVQGVIPLTLPGYVFEDSKPTAQATFVKETPKESKKKEPAPLKKSQKPETLSSQTRAAFHQTYFPTGGMARSLEWIMAQSLLSEDKKYTAILNYYQACKGIPSPSQIRVFDPKISIYNQSVEGLFEYDLTSSANPADFDISWHNDTLEIRFLGEVLRKLPVSGRNFGPVKPKKQTFTVQLASYSEEASAQEQMQELCERGLPAYYLEFQDDPSGKSMYRVRVGRFPDRQNAELYASEKVQTPDSNYLITFF